MNLHAGRLSSVWALNILPDPPLSLRGGLGSTAEGRARQSRWLTGRAVLNWSTS